MRRTSSGILAALLLLAATACTVTQKDPDYVPSALLPALEQLKQAPLTDPAAPGAGQDYLSFVTADRNVACSLTSARGEHINLPYEQNGFGGSGTGKFATVPVAHCELAVYPKPDVKDIRDNCSGTGLGYLGGTALLTPDQAVYGECRSAYNGGVACGNVSAGVAFFISRDRYELISPVRKTASPAPSEAPKTP